MRAPKERLTHLLELAAQGNGARGQLANELADILLDWPSEYTDAARLPFEALLEKTLREIDRNTRATIAARFARRADAPVELLNQLFFSASAEMKDEIVARNAGSPAHDDEPPDVDEVALLGVARNGRERFVPELARLFAISDDTADEILRDISGQSLAIACRGAHAGRATFSALAVLADRRRAAEDSYLRLATYDTIPQAAAERMLAYWRSQADNQAANAAQ